MAVDIEAGWWILFTTLQTRREVELKCVPYLVLGLLLGLHQSIESLVPLFVD